MITLAVGEREGSGGVVFVGAVKVVELVVSGAVVVAAKLSGACKSKPVMMASCVLAKSFFIEAGLLLMDIVGYARFF